MRTSSLAFAALIGAAAASPFERRNNYGYVPNPYPTGGSSSGYPTHSSSSSTTLPTGESSYPPHPTKNTEYPHQPGPTGESSYPPHPTKDTEYPHQPGPTGGSSYPPHPTKNTEYPHPPGPTGGSSYPPYPPHPSGYPPHPHGPYPTGGSPSPPHNDYPTGGSPPDTTTKTYNHPPTTYPPGSGPITETHTLTSTTYTFVPCSTTIGYNGPAPVYSTYLTASYYPTTYTTEVVVYPTPPSQPSVVNPVTYPTDDVTYPTECPAVATVTVTVQPEPCKHCQVKTYTITDGGYPTTITYTVNPTDEPTYEPTHEPTHEPTYEPTDKPTYAPEPPVPTGGSAYPSIPTGTGGVLYPTHGPSSDPSYSASRTGPKPTGYPLDSYSY